jgi:sterol-4alpha-carboxylate 3-dehydrogenase (decarboxylating)
MMMKRNLDRYINANVHFDIVMASKRFDGARTILLTGGNGFVGKHIVAALAQKGSNVVVFDLTLPNEASRRADVSYVCGDLLNPEHVGKALTIFKPDSVIHTASLVPFLGVPDEAIRTVNIDGSRILLEACGRFGVRSFIYTSSATAALERSTRISENMDEDSPTPRQYVDTYAASKAAVERLVTAVTAVDGMATCVLRPTAIFGRGDKLISDKLALGMGSFFIGDGSALLDWVPVESVALAHALAEEALSTDSVKRRRISGKVYFIGNNEQRGYGWFIGADSVDGAGGHSHWGHPPARSLPIWLVFGLAYMNLGMYKLTGMTILPPSLAPSLIDFTQRTYTFRSDRAARDFGYTPSVSVSDAIRRIVEERKGR